MTERTTRIREEDWQLLATLSEREGRSKTEILHRALEVYSEKRKGKK